MLHRIKARLTGGIFKGSGRTRFGTFGGVFTPSVLTILGIILYMRTGYVVGIVGLGDALLIMGMCFLISILTSMSLAVIATHMRIKSGGFYYVISRTLGVEFGGALGLILFLSISIGVAFYAVGLAEVAVTIWDLGGARTAQWIAAGAILFFFVFAWIGADWATKLQYFVMLCVAASLVAFFWGAFGSYDSERLAENFAVSDSGGFFWVAFALFFPAITGFTQGLNMSGDLKDPERAIPIGTFLAVGISALLYLGVAVFLAAGAENVSLRTDTFIMERVSAVGWLIPVGVIAATASSAMASILGAPRVLQAMARDEVFPRLKFFGAGHGSDDNPRRAVMLSAAIALGAVALGDLNFLAPIITMFFLASYTLLNYATFFVWDADSPSFRPRFHYSHKYLSLAGALACVAAMLAINPLASLGAGAVMLALHLYLRRAVGVTKWSDTKRAFGFRRIRNLLFEINRSEPHPRDWRPQILVLSNDPSNRTQLLRLASWLDGLSGLTTLVHVMESDDPATPRRQEIIDEFEESIEDAGIDAFSLVVAADSFRAGFRGILQTYGIGPIRPNTLLLNLLEEESLRADSGAEQVYGTNIEEAIRFGMNVIILSANPGFSTAIVEDEAKPREIDIWWNGGETSRLMTVMAYLMTRTELWEDAKIRVLAQGKSDHPERTAGALQRYLEEARVEADVEAVETIDAETIGDRSIDADLVFFPYEVENGHLKAAYGLKLSDVAKALPAVAFFVAGSEVELDADPDENGEEEEAANPDAETDAPDPKDKG